MLVQSTKADVYPKIDPLNPESGLANSANGRTVIVTGASGGCGRAMAVFQAKAGAEVVVLAGRSQSELQNTADEIGRLSSSSKVIICVTDVTNKDSVKNLIETAVKASKPETAYTLFNNAGFMEKTVPIAESDPDVWWKTWEVNVKGVYLVARYMLDHLSKNSTGKNYIINTSSIGSTRTRPNLSSYQASKSAVNRFTDFLAAEASETHNLITFAIHPGGVMTTLATEMPKELHSVLTDTPELVGGFGVWLTSGAVDWANGRYLSANWDVKDILAKKDEVVNTEYWKSVVLE